VNNHSQNSPPKIDATGNKWWRVDFHTHTPHSWDAHRTVKNKDGTATITEREWLLAHMSKGLDAVVITDHNGGGWIDRLKAENEQMRREEPKAAGYRPLALYPGVEITVADGFHVLVILDPKHGTQEISALLGTTISAGHFGSHEVKSSESVETLLERLKSQDYIVIPAHVNGPKGLLENTVDARTRKAVLQHDMIYAVESFWKTPIVFDPNSHGVPKRQIVTVYGSDSHEKRDIGVRSTWVRMSEPTLDGLRVALLDGAASVRKFDDDLPNPGPHSPYVLRRLSIAKTKYIGRVQPLAIEINPSFNAIIGGRGTGKSSLVELIRKATKRDAALESSGGELAKNMSSLLQSITSGMTEACVQVDYELHGKVFRMQWTAQTGYELLEVDGSGQFMSVADGGTWTERFPLRIFSQKQLYEFRARTAPLLNEVDGTPTVSGAAWQREWDHLQSEFIQLRARIQTLNAQLNGRGDIEAKLLDKKRQLEALEKAGHKEILRNLALRRRQKSEIEKWLRTTDGLADEVRDAAGKLAFGVGNLQLSSDAADANAEHDLEKAAQTLLAALTAEADVLVASAERIEAAIATWNQAHAASEWLAKSVASEAAYQALVSQLQGSGAKPEQYGELVQDIQVLQKQLDQLDGIQKQLEAAKASQKERFAELVAHRKLLTEKRKEFLQAQFATNERLRAELVPFGDLEEGLKELRRLLSREGASETEFERISEYLNGNGADLEDRISKLKKHLATRSDDAAVETGLRLGAPFLNHLATRTSEDISRLWSWFPPDLLRLSYRTDGGSFRPLDRGSPGQVAAAVLAFLLAYGEEPMILDQPEDDLDNRLIYDLIVEAIHTNKLRRQIIIVTHNPNIVVNGNADLVLPLEDRSGQTAIPCKGSLQSDEVRKSVCEIMEGGREALKRRFRQIVH
jgi:histidinol phosphatase-like PHP family hydrolase